MGQDNRRKVEIRDDGSCQLELTAAEIEVLFEGLNLVQLVETGQFDTAIAGTAGGGKDRGLMPKISRPDLLTLLRQASFSFTGDVYPPTISSPKVRNVARLAKKLGHRFMPDAPSLDDQYGPRGELL